MDYGGDDGCSTRSERHTDDFMKGDKTHAAGSNILGLDDVEVSFVDDEVEERCSPRDSAPFTGKKNSGPDGQDSGGRKKPQ